MHPHQSPLYKEQTTQYKSRTTPAMPFPFLCPFPTGSGKIHSSACRIHTSFLLFSLSLSESLSLISQTRARIWSRATIQASELSRVHCSDAAPQSLLCSRYHKVSSRAEAQWNESSDRGLGTGTEQTTERSRPPIPFERRQSSHRARHVPRLYPHMRLPIVSLTTLWTPQGLKAR